MCVCMCGFIGTHIQPDPEASQPLLKVCFHEKAPDREKLEDFNFFFLNLYC